MTSRTIPLGGFAATGLALVVLWLDSRRPAGTIERPSTLLLRLMRRRAPRIVVLLAWWWIGWHFLAFQNSA